MDNILKARSNFEKRENPAKCAMSGHVIFTGIFGNKMLSWRRANIIALFIDILTKFYDFFFTSKNRKRVSNLEDI